MPNDPLIEEYVEKFKKEFKHISGVCEVGVDPFRDEGDCNCYKKDYQNFLRTSLKEYGDKRVGEIEKAYGGCKKRYGKGYSTEQQGKIGNGRVTLRNPEIVMNYCKNCERGKQLKSFITQKQ